MDSDNHYSWVMSHLSPKESILWRGRPERVPLLSASDLLLIPLSIFWCWLIVKWARSLLGKGSVPLTLLGILLVIAGAYLLFGRFLHKRFVSRHTFYAVTDRKLLRRMVGRTDILQDGVPAPTDVIRHRDGTTSLYFGQNLKYVPFLHSFPGSYYGFCMERLADGDGAIAAIDVLRNRSA